MGRGLYLKLAIDGIKKNKKLYIPYIISLLGMVAISYVIFYLRVSPALSGMRGTDVLRVIMSLGVIVMVVFSVCFLFYTNSFLAKRRNFEFALYNILGMNKKNVIRILINETVIIGLLGLAFGFGFGILLSKLFELLLIKMCGYSPDYSFYLSWGAALEITLFYAAIMLLLFFFAAAKVIINKPIDLLRSTNAGEKEPKTKAVKAIIGILLLGAAYYIAVSIEEPVESITYFFGAVIMVIVATYFLFEAGSVFICKLLKKNKDYYYKPNHFVAVSGMIYRMKRNGTGLASICVLSTMVLVMLSSTGALYIGKNSSINMMYPHDITASVRLQDYNVDLDKIETDLRNSIKSVFPEVTDSDMEMMVNFTYLGEPTENGTRLYRDDESIKGWDTAHTLLLEVADVDIYNKCSGTNFDLAEDEAIFVGTKNQYKKDTITINDKTYRIKEYVEEEGRATQKSIVKSYSIIIKDAKAFEEYFKAQNTSSNSGELQIGFDTNLPAEEQAAKADELQHMPHDTLLIIYCKQQELLEFTDMYASLLLLGVFLSIVFMGACAFIIYYKQLTEGYEDKAAYKTMQSVGMTVKEIKRGVNSQTLITFFSPLLMAGLHLIFSGPLVYKIMLLLGLYDKTVFVLSYIICFLAFALFYLIVYRRTVKAYVEIVSV